MRSKVSRNLSAPCSPSLARPWLAVDSWVRSHPFKMVLGAVGLGITVLHLHRLTSSPPGFYVDEESIGYNAYAI